MWSVNKLLVFEQKVLQNIFGPIQEAVMVSGEFDNCELEELYNNKEYCGTYAQPETPIGWTCGEDGLLPMVVKMLNLAPGGRSPLRRSKKRWSDSLHKQLIQIGIGIT